MNVSIRVCEFVHTLSWDELPAEIREAGRAAVNRTIQRISGGADEGTVNRIVQALQTLGMVGRTNPPGRAEQLSPYASALVAGAAAYTAQAEGAEAATVVGALVTGQIVEARESEVLTAVVAGLEVATRIGEALGPVHAARGWDRTGTLGAMGAAVAAGRVRHLDSTQLRQAMSLAATQAAGHREQRTAPAAAIHAGKAAADGVEAAHLAAHGFVGPAEPLTGRRGMAALMSDGLEVDVLMAGLGSRWSITSTDEHR